MWNRQLQMVGHLQEERQQIAVLLSRQSPFEHCRCFDINTKGADGAADLLEALRNSPLEKLNFKDCYRIPSTAWQKLRVASWTNLREANFSRCLVLQTWLRCLASSLWRRVLFFECKGPLSRLFLWQQLTTLKGQKCEIHSCKWSDLQKSLARGAATDCRPFVDSSEKMAYLCHPLTWHIVKLSSSVGCQNPWGVPLPSMRNFINNIDTWRAAKNPLFVILLDIVGTHPINGTSALEVKKWGSSCFWKMH